MSEKKKETTQKKPLSKGLKFVFYIFLIAFLLAGLFFAAVKFFDSRYSGEDIKLGQIATQLSEQNVRIKTLEQLPVSVSANTQQLASTAHALSILSERFNQLYEETGNNKMEKMAENLQAFDHRIAGMEEQKNTDALILSVALLIKENALYHRSFIEEADVLTELNQQNEKNMPEINIINQYKSTDIADNQQLAQRFAEIMEDFNFSQPTENQEKKETKFSKSIKMIKDTVSGMHFDKVVVLKKEKKTEHQQKLLDTLSKMVNAYEYANALEFIRQNRELAEVDNKDFTQWQNRAKDKVTFDAAVSKLVANQLKNLREDIKSETLSKPVVQSAPTENADTPSEENVIND